MCGSVDGDVTTRTGTRSGQTIIVRSPGRDGVEERYAFDPARQRWAVTLREHDFTTLRADAFARFEALNRARVGVRR